MLAGEPKHVASSWSVAIFRDLRQPRRRVSSGRIGIVCISATWARASSTQAFLGQAVAAMTEPALPRDLRSRRRGSVEMQRLVVMIANLVGSGLRGLRGCSIPS